MMHRDFWMYIAMFILATAVLFPGMIPHFNFNGNNETTTTDTHTIDAEQVCRNSCAYRNLSFSQYTGQLSGIENCYCSWHNKEIKVY